MTEQSSEKTTIRLTKQDREILAKLGQVLGHKLGKAGTASQSDVIRYSLRQLAERELGEGGTKNG